MSTRSRGKRLAAGITAAVGAGSFAAAGIAAAAVYASTPSVIARTNSTSSPQGSVPNSAGSDGQEGGSSGSRLDGGTRHSRSYGNASPVQPGSGGIVHGRSSGS